MVEASLKNTRLRIQYVVGQNEQLEPIIRAKTYNNIKKSASANDLHATAVAIASLSEYELESIERNDILLLV